MDGLIFDIQRFSVYDGPGIRTNVFFKGCPLKCLWCHNPESQTFRPELMVFESKCVHCGKCTQVCKNTFLPECTACGQCVKVCENGARKISGRTVSDTEVMETVKRDVPFYETSGGGITLSGGEPLMQPEFAFSLLKLSRENGINTAVETAGFASWSVFEKILPFTDLFLFDIKGMDETIHIRNTGVSNGLILSNAERLMKAGVRIRFRMPYIPGVNSEELKDIKRFTGKYPLELMAYHKTGVSKYASLGRKYTLADVTEPEKSDVNNIASENGCMYNE